MEKIILASSSPRRAELLHRLSIPFEVVSSGVSERVDPGMPPEDVVALWSRRKALEVSKRFPPDRIVLGADTVIWHGGTVLGKPLNRDDAVKMLKQMAGDWHTVYTGVTIRRGDQVQTQEDITMVHMRPLSDEDIIAYVNTGEPMDKAGSYGIQERGALLMDRIDGDFYNVMGLPLCRLAMMLSDFGINLIGGV